MPTGVTGPDHHPRAADAGVETVLVLGRPLLVLRKIGDGANSFVYHAINSYMEHLPRELAVKRSFFNKEDAVRAHAEIDLMQRLKDPSLVECYTSEVVTIDGKLSVSAVMELCGGGSLVHHMQRVSELQRGTSLPEGMVLRVALCVVSGLTYLHSQNPPMAHRDVKAENVLMRAEMEEDAVATLSGSNALLVSSSSSSSPQLLPVGQFKLCDFGSVSMVAHHSIAKADVLRVSDEIEATTTAGYRSPELCDPWSGQRIDEKVDVWALGVLLYYLLFFKLPFGETALGVLNGTLEFPTHAGGGGGPAPLREGLLRLVKACLVRSSDRRPSVFDLVATLRADAALGPAGAVSYRFACATVPVGWTPQPVRSTAALSNASAAAPLLRGLPVAPSTTSSVGGGADASDRKAHGHSLFAQLDWATAQPPQLPGQGIVGPTAAPSLFSNPTTPPQLQLQHGAKTTTTGAAAAPPSSTNSSSLFDALDQALFAHAQGASLTCGARTFNGMTNATDGPLRNPPAASSTDAAAHLFGGFSPPQPPPPPTTAGLSSGPNFVNLFEDLLLPAADGARAFGQHRAASPSTGDPLAAFFKT